MTTLDTLIDYKQLVEALADAVIAADPSGAIRFWNLAAEHLFGFTEAEALGNSLDLIVPERFRERHWAAYNRTMATGQSRCAHDVLRVPAVHKDGRPLSHGNGGSNRKACPASVPTPSEPQPITSRCFARNGTNSGCGPGTCAPSSLIFRNAVASLRFDQSVRISTQDPASIRPCCRSQASACCCVSRKSGLPAVSCETSITQAGAKNFSTVMVSVAFFSKAWPVTQCMGASLFVDWRLSGVDALSLFVLGKPFA